MAKVYRDINEDTLNLSFTSSENVSIFVDNNLKINYELKDGDYSILVFNNGNSNIELTETGKVINSNVKISYLDLNQFNFIHDNNLEVFKNSTLTINSTYLGINTKKIKFNLINKESESEVNISNNVVCLDNADFSMNVIGKIEKGAKRSKCHQKNRCLTFEKPKSSKILPVLLIDENDVEASHSLSSGTIDEDVLFYMNSRGLSKKDALKLLLVSYLMPVDEFYNEFMCGEEIKDKVNKKVSSICLM